MALDYLVNTTKTCGINMRRGKPRPISTESSPCIEVCEFKKGADECKGCHRTIDEIREWIIMTDEEKRKVKEKIHARRNP